MMESFLTAEQAARVLRLHVKRVQALARAGRLPATRVGRKWLFSRAALEARFGPSGAPAPRVEISGRNQLQGTVAEVRLGDVMAEVRVRIGDQEVVSIITRSSAERLGLNAGAPVLAIVKATDVMLGRP
jgi:molybdopterin-binding protein